MGFNPNTHRTCTCGFEGQEPDCPDHGYEAVIARQADILVSFQEQVLALEDEVRGLRRRAEEAERDLDIVTALAAGRDTAKAPESTNDHGGLEYP